VAEPTCAYVLLAGDTHGRMEQVRYLIGVAIDKGCTRIVQVGDFGYWPHMEPFHERVNSAAMKAGIDWYWLDGNHENFDALEEAVDVNAAEPQQMLARLWYLPRGCTWEWDGCRFMALGGAYSIDRHHRLPGHSWWEQELLTREQVERAMDRGPVDVLLTHDAPEGVCPIVTSDYKGDEISRGNRKAVSAVVEAVTPRLVTHGHYHHRYSAKIPGGPQVEGLGRDGEWLDSWLLIRPSDWMHAKGESGESRG
jgi:hypothetical protein